MSLAASPGRPRDPEVDKRITLAALDLFGRDGWAGFSIESVARLAGVGKASIYLRWQTKEQLLLDALARHLVDVSDVDTGTLRGDLGELTRQLLRLYTGRGRQAALRTSLEAGSIPGLADRWEQLRASQAKAARAIVRRGIDRGEIPAGTPVTLLLDTLCGGVMMHVLSTPAHLSEQLAAQLDDYAEVLVEFLVRPLILH